MRILLAGDTYPPDVNGAAIFARRLAERLAARGHEVHVVSPSPAGFSYLEDVAGVRLHRVPSFRYPWHDTFHIADLRKVRRAVGDVVCNVEPDIIHVQSHFTVGRCAAAHARRSDTPWVATNHFMPDNLRSQLPFVLPGLVYRGLCRLSWWDLKRVFGPANVVTAPTTYAIDVLRTRAMLPDAVAVSCGVNVDDFDGPTERSEGGRKVVLFVGRIEIEKHVNDILDALALLETTIQLRIVGVGSQERALRRQAVSLGVERRVEFLGPLNDDQLRDELLKAHVFCMPGTAELQSIATLEAMAAGLPVVAADALALPALVTPSVNGELYPPGDVAELASALGRVLRTEDIRRAYGKASREMVRHHDLTTTVAAFERIYAAAARTGVR